MSYQTILCVVVRCDDCHAAAPDGQHPIGHWPGGSVRAAALPGWHANGSVHRCPRCQARRDCAAAGHQYGPWTPLAGSPDELAERVCTQCGAGQLAPAYASTPVPRPGG